MHSFAGWLLATILTILSLLHVYWAFGGRRGTRAAVPQKSAATAESLFTPPMFLTLLVALALALGAAIELVVAGLVAPPDAIASWFRPLACVLAVTFLVRAIGERRYVGFFKRVRGTEFARWDDRLFSPLCTGIALLTLAVVFTA